jgi:hypothetical protein
MFNISAGNHKGRNRSFKGAFNGKFSCHKVQIAFITITVL